jgi:hypothetical protein
MGEQMAGRPARAGETGPVRWGAKGEAFVAFQAVLFVVIAVGPWLDEAWGFGWSTWPGAHLVGWSRVGVFVCPV